MSPEIRIDGRSVRIGRSTTGADTATAPTGAGTNPGRDPLAAPRERFPSSATVDPRAGLRGPAPCPPSEGCSWGDASPRGRQGPSLRRTAPGETYLRPSAVPAHTSVLPALAVPAGG